MVNTSDSGSRGWGFEPYSCCRVVSLSKTYLPPKVLVIPRKLWLSPNMTKNCLPGFKHQTNKTKIRQEDLKTSGITLGLKTEGNTQGFQYISRDLINNDN